MDQCFVTGVRNPQRVTRWVRIEDDGWGRHDHDSELMEIVVNQSVSVSLDCSR